MATSIPFPGLPTDSMGADLTQCIQLAIGARRLSPAPSHTLLVGEKSYRLESLLGEGTARVYLTQDRAHVVKLFSLNHRAQAQLEYWTTLYYTLRNVNVLPMTSPPTETHYNGESVIAIVRPYVTGLTASEFKKLCQDGPSQLTGCAELEAQRNHLRQSLRMLHEDGKFIAWLIAHNVNLQQEFGGIADTLDFVDLADGNFLLTRQGWLVIDP